LNSGEFVFEGSDHFTGIEWHNIIGNFSYPIRYSTEVLQLMYGDLLDLQSIIYRPYNVLIPNNEGSNVQYPVSFHNARIKDGCICFNIASGNCNTGLTYNHHS
jgi:hypothetical protein